MRSLVLFTLTAASVGFGADFGRDVHPILNSRCASCHSQNLRQGGLSVMSVADLLKGGASGTSVIPGKSGDSLLIQRITGAKLPLMPMGGARLSEREVALIREWIDEGATPGTSAKSAWVAPLKPRKPPVPGSGHPIDAFLKLDNRVVSDDVFVRRAYLDLHGVPPNPTQRTSFLNKRSQSRRAELIDELLANRKAYANHWISYWNDLLHNDEGVVYHGERKSITNWLLNALEKNLPYDQFVAELLNPSRPSGPEGFLLGVNWRGDINASQTPVMQAAQNSAQVFMGINIKCASCHDSFINKWKLKDSYGLASFFADGPLEIVRCDAKTGEKSAVKFLYPELGGVPADASLAERRTTAAKLFTHPENGRLARTFVNRIWERLMGRGFVEHSDDMDEEPWNPDLLDWLASDFADHAYDVQRLLRQIMTSAAYQLPSVDPPVPYKFAGPAPRKLTAEQFADSISAITGEWRTLVSPKPEPARYVRDWQLKASPLARALGRPVRDLAVTSRADDASTLQALELVNGSTLATMLQRGALRLVKEWKEPPAALFDSGVLSNQTATADIDIAGLREIRLLVVDWDSYDASRVVAGWADARLEGRSGSVPLSDLAGATADIRHRGQPPAPGVAASLGKEIVVPIQGRGFTRFKARAGNDERTLMSEINPRTRFFVFSAPPDRTQLLRTEGPPPIPRAEPPSDRKALITYLFEHAFSRTPTPAEMQTALEIAGPKGAAGVEDLLWVLALSPEFRAIR